MWQLHFLDGQRFISPWSLISIYTIFNTEFRVALKASILITHLFAIVTLVEFYFCYFLFLRSRCSDSLRAGRPGVRIPVRAKCSASMQTSSCVLRISLPGIKRPRCRGDHPPPPLSPPVGVRVELYFNLRSTYSWLITGWPLSLTYCTYKLCTRQVCRM